MKLKLFYILLTVICFNIYSKGTISNITQDLISLVELGNLKEIKNYINQTMDITKSTLEAPIATAIKNNETEILQFLLDISLERKGHWSCNTSNPLCIAVKNKKKELIDLLLDYKLFDHVSFTKDNPRKRLTEKENLSEEIIQESFTDIEMFKFIMTKEQIVNNNLGLQHFLWAAGDIENPEFAEIIFSKQANIESPDAIGGFTEAITKGNLKTAQVFLDYGVSIDKNPYGDQNSPLHSAVGHRNIEAVKFLLERGANINIQNDYGLTPIHYACYFDIKIVQYLLEQGASLNIKTKKLEYTPVHSAIDSESIPILEYLLSKGGSLDCKYFKNKWSLLHVAVTSQNIDMVKYILKYNQNINAQDIEGKTALHHAVHLYLFDIAHFLIDNGASIEIKDSQGKSSHDYLNETYEHEKQLFQDEEKCKEHLRETIRTNLYSPTYLFNLKEAYEKNKDMLISLPSHFASLGERLYTLDELFDDPSALINEQVTWYKEHPCYED